MFWCFPLYKKVPFHYKKHDRRTVSHQDRYRGASFMIIKKLEITGFKSFRDKTVFHFTPGVSAVVGPNGCGKSNVVDAIRWVMGEQRVRSLRGKRMEDVIFNGSEGASAVGMAEVSLLLEANGRPFSGAFSHTSEVMVTRKIFRNEESEYLINQVPCRLMDIREFFMDSGIGARTYSIIEQESISRLVEAKPEDIREFIEEAAGIAKYKSRRDAAARKLEATGQNMARLRDIVAEVRTRLEQLAKQVKRVEEYRRLKEKMKEGEVSLVLQSFHEIRERADLLSRQRTETDDRLLALRNDLASRESLLEESRGRLLEMEEEASRIQEAVFRKKSGISTLEQRIEYVSGKIRDLGERLEKGALSLRMLGERKEQTAEEVLREKDLLSGLGEEIESARAAVQELQDGLAALRDREEETAEQLEEAKARNFERTAERGRLGNTLQGLMRAMEDLDRRKERETRELEELEHRAGELRDRRDRCASDLSESAKALTALREEIGLDETDLREGRKELERLNEELSRLKGELGEKRSRLESLREFRESYEWCDEGTRSVMTAKREGNLPGEGIYGVLADHVKVSKEYEPALEAVLGERLQHVLVRSHEEGVRAVDYLKQSLSGRGHFIPLGARGAGAAGRMEGFPEGAVRLRDHVLVEEPFSGMLDALIGDAVVLPDLSSAIRLWDRNGFSGTFVTPGGEVIDPRGILAGGRGTNGAGNHLKNRREIDELAGAVGETEDRLDGAKRNRDAVQDGLRRTEEALAGKRSAAGDLELVCQGKKKDIERMEGEAKWLEKRLSVLRFNRETLDSEKRSAEEKALDLRRKIVSLDGEAASLDEALKELKEAWREVREELARHESELTEERVLLSSLEEKKKGAEAHLERQEKAIAEAARQMEERKRELETWAEEKTGLESAVLRDRDDLREAYREFGKLEEQQSARKEERDREEEAVRLREGEIRDLRKRIDEISGELNRLDVRIGETNIQGEALRNGIFEKHRVRLEECLPGFRPLGEEELNKLEEALSRYRRKMETFGEINLLAEQEYGELKERHDFLAGQLDDLDASVETLKKTIAKMNALSKKNFMETFTAVSEAFREVFPRIFPGGKGELRLTDEGNLLESGVDMDIQIPGKKRQNLSLLSGGEKALCSISLIFSILVHRSSPFLVLDEVDAPLDDSNVSLFKRLIREIAGTSQVILITHNKKTMEISDSLIGITMEKSGISSTVSVSLN
jgi:chromosome segregation protein